MEHRQLAHTGVSVSKFCLGAMMFGAWGNPDHDDSIRIIHAALDAGINFVDTADVYGHGESEEIVGKALAGGRRDNTILATKFHNAMGEHPNQQGNSEEKGPRSGSLLTFRVMGDTGLEPVTSALSRRRSPS